MSEVAKPEIIEASYVSEVKLNRVNKRGLDLSGDFPKIAELTLDAIFALETLPYDLAWVNFFKRAVLRVRYPEESGIAGEESFYGKRKQVGEDQFVIDHSDGKPVFKTKAEILESGELSTYMRQWLTLIAENPQVGSYEYWDFEGLLGRSLK